MTFKIYDSSFRLLETIHHDERVILDCEYDSQKDMLIMSGAAGETLLLADCQDSTLLTL
jgi:hypothetical protein